MSNANKGAVGLIPALELASLTNKVWGRTKEIRDRRKRLDSRMF